MIWNVLTILLATSQLFQLSQGLNCFVCNSAFNKDCGQSPPPKEYIVECTGDTAQPLPIQHGKLTLPKSTNTPISNETVNPLLEKSTTSNTIPTSITTESQAGAETTNANVAKHERMQNALAFENEIHLSMNNNINYTFCRKTITSIPKQHNRDNIKEADRRIIRSCGWIEDGKMNAACKWADSGEIQNEYCVCNTNDACNHGISRTTASIIGIPMISLMALIATNFIRR